MWVELSKEGKSGGGIGLALESKIFGENGEEWPRLAINIYKDVSKLKVDISIKKKEGVHWQPCKVPEELKTILDKMIKEVERRRK